MKEWILKVVVVAVTVLVVLLVFYYVASPYQNCVRKINAPKVDAKVMDFCINKTSW